jgi:hypothetical protein
MSERLAAKAVAREGVENALSHSPRDFEAHENCLLINFVGDSEALLQTDFVAELAQELRAKRVNGSSLDAFHASAELAIEPRRDLSSRLVGESENANASGVEFAVLDKESHALDKAIGFSSPGTRTNKQGLRVGFNRGPLGRSGDAWNGRGTMCWCRDID